MIEITTQKLKRRVIQESPDPRFPDIEYDLYELILKQDNDLRYIETKIDDKTIERLWDISEPCDYIKARSLEYPSWDEQFDDQYWDKKNGTDTWIKKIDDVKLKYPKP